MFDVFLLRSALFQSVAIRVHLLPIRGEILLRVLFGVIPIAIDSINPRQHFGHGGIKLRWNFASNRRVFE